MSHPFKVETGGSGGGSGHGTGSVLAHSDVSDAGSGEIITDDERTAIAANESHVSATSGNPHNVTAAESGADPAGTASSSMSTHEGEPDPHPGYVLETREAALNGIATLDGTGNVPLSQLGNVPGGGGGGDVTSVNGETGVVVLDADNIEASAARLWLSTGEAAEIAANTLKETNATHSGDVTGSGVLTIADEAVTLSKMALIDSLRFLGRVTGSTGAVESLTVSEVLTALGAGSADGIATLDTDSGVPTSQLANATKSESWTAQIGLDLVIYISWRAPKDATIEEVKVTPLGSDVPGSAANDVTLGGEILRLPSNLVLLDVAAANIEGGTLNTPSSLTLSTPAGVDVDEDEIVEFTIVMPSDITPIPVDGVATGAIMIDLVWSLR